MQNYQIVTPNWFKIESMKSTKSNNNRKRDPDDSSQPPRKSKKVINENVCPACSLAPNNEIYRFVFHRNNMTDLEVPKFNGIELCLKYHVEGKCKSTCTRAKSHGQLDQPTLVNLRKFVKAVKEKYRAFKAKFRKSDENSESKTEGKPDK